MWLMIAAVAVVAVVLGMMALGNDRQPPATPASASARSSASADRVTPAGGGAVVEQPSPANEPTEELQSIAVETGPTSTAVPAPGETATPRPSPDAPTPDAPTPTAPPPTIAADTEPEALTIGRTDRGTPVEAVRFGDGAATVFFIGGLHAGFAPATVALARQAVDYFTDYPERIPAGVTLYIVISASPDTSPAVGELAGRLNSNGVDANRNWDCSWAEDARWRNQLIPGSGGPAPFSEPEVRALADLIVAEEAAAVVFWEALAENGLSSPGNCGVRTNVSGPLATLYGTAAGYEIGDFEQETGQLLNGDASNWLDSIGIPAIAVLLPGYETIDLAANLAGMLAVLEANGR